MISELNYRLLSVTESIQVLNRYLEVLGWIKMSKLMINRDKMEDLWIRNSVNMDGGLQFILDWVHCTEEEI